MATKVRLDQNLNNADWTKQSWDLLGVNTKQELKEYLKESGMTMAEFKKLPVYKLNKDKFEALKSYDLFDKAMRSIKKTK